MKARGSAQPAHRALVAAVAGSVWMLTVVAILVVGLPFWTVGGLTRVLRPVFTPRVMPWRDLIAFDQALGWKPRAGIDGHVVEERDDVFRVATDAEGWPGPGRLDDADVIALGDSHVFGYGVDPPVAFWSRTGPMRIKPVGAPGYNMAQELLLLRELGPRLRGKTVAWFVYPGNDLFDNLSPQIDGYRAPFVRRRPEDGAWEIVDRHVSAAPWTASRGRRGRFHLPVLAALHAPTPLAERAQGAAAYLLAEGRHLCETAGARLVVVVIPVPLTLSPRGIALLEQHADPGTRIDPGRPERGLAGSCEVLGVPCLRLSAHLERADYKPVDDHWTPRGHRRVARALAGFVSERRAA
jgi:hypothetical protein